MDFVKLHAAGNWKALEIACRAALASAPSDANLRARLALADYNLGRYPDAAGLYRKLIDDYPGELDYQTGYAWALHGLGKRKEARAVFQAVLAVSPDNVNAKQGIVSDGALHSRRRRAWRADGLGRGIRLGPLFGCSLSAGELLDPGRREQLLRGHLHRGRRLPAGLRVRPRGVGAPALTTTTAFPIGGSGFGHPSGHGGRHRGEVSPASTRLPEQEVAETASLGGCHQAFLPSFRACPTTLSC